MVAIYVSAIIATFLLINTSANVFLLRRARQFSSEVDESITVLVPMRNEAGNVVALIESLRNQIGLRKVLFCLVNDNSSDNTFQLAAESIGTDKRFQLHQAPPLESGWLGKPATLQFGLRQSTSEIVVFLDADVRLEYDAIARAITTLKALNLNFISAYPMQIANTWSEKLIQPLLQWSWMATVPLRYSERSRNPAFSVANGQFFIIERRVLDSIQGLERIKDAVLDDIYLARELVRSGFHGTTIDGSRIARCRMYSSWKELREGYGKSLHIAFGSILGTIFASTLFLLTGILPLLFALAGSKVGLFALLAIIFTRILSSYTCRGRPWLAITHPFSMLLLIYLLAYSWTHRETVQWKGRQL